MGRKCESYSGNDIDLEELVEEIEKAFKFRNYDVQISNPEQSSNYQYRVLVRKTSKLRKIVGVSKNVEITINGKPDKFTVCTTFQIRQNLIANTTTTLPIHIASWGFTLPFTIAPTLFYGTRFEDDVWNIITKIIDDFNK
jgi:hypothetical protein